MPVSFVSKPIASNPYVPILDLNLFSRVLDVKQQQYNQGFAKEQAQIDSLANMDIMRDVDKQYLNNKINGLVQGINSLGGVNYSDAGIQNQIEGLGADVYADNNVITAVSSTKSARNLINQYENYKSNPKLKGYYSEANETLDKEKINQWIQNPNVGAQYQGPSSATPYEEYQKSLAKQMEKLQADKYTYLTDKGLYYEKESGQLVTPERVKQAAIDLMTPAQAAQMKRDGIYQFKYINRASPEQLIGKALGQFQEQLTNASSLQTHYQSLANAAVSDPQARQKYLELAQNQASEVSRLNAASKTVGQNAVNSYRNDPEGLMGQLYTNDFVRGLANVYSYNKVDKSIQADQAEMFQLRQAEDARQFNLGYNQKERFEQSKESVELFKAGLKYETDINGNRKLSKIPAGQAGSLESIDANTGDPSDLKVTEKGLYAENQQYHLQIDQANREIISNLQATNPNMFVTQQSSASPGGWLYSLKGQSDLEGLNGQSGFQIDDLAGLDYTNPANFNRRNALISKGNLTAKDLDQLSQWYKDYDSITKGKTPLSGNLPPAFISGVEKTQLLNLGLQTNKATIDAISESALKEAMGKVSLTPQERQVAMGITKPPEFKDGYRIGISGPSRNPLQGVRASTGSKAVDNVLKDVESIKERYYSQRGLRTNRFGRAFTENEIKQRGTEFQNFIYSDATANGGTFTPLQGASPLPTSEVKSSQITPVRSGIGSDGKPYIDSEITVGATGKQSSGLYRTYLSEKNAGSVGVYTDPFEEINRSLDMTGKADNLYIHGGKNLALKVVIQKSTDNLNDNSAQAWGYLSDGNKVPIPGAVGGTGSEAYARAKTWLKAIDNGKVSREDLINYMIKQYQ